MTKCSQAQLPEGFNDRWRVSGFRRDALKEGGPFRGMVGRSLGYERRDDMDVVRLIFDDGREATFLPHELFPAREGA